jgi:flagellar biosynthetic protein FlhB
VAEENDNEKTEDPTPQRREDFRKKGQVAQSREVASVLLLFTSVLILFFLGRYFMFQLQTIFTMSFTDFLLKSAQSGDWIEASKFAVTKSASIVLPMAGILWFAGVASTLMQVGFINNEEAIEFNLKKIDPAEGLKRLLSMRSFVEGGKAVIKVSIVAVIVYFIFQSEIYQIPKLATFEMQQIISYTNKLLFKLVGGVGIFMAIVAALDFFYQRWDLEQKMRMTKQEVKEEHKSREGDPLVRARVRRLQREIASRRMMSDVKKADVVITNPTHIAIALVYNDELPAPRLIAKGAGEIAEQIKKVAKELKIPVIENKPLARTIFKTMKIGQIIPRQLYSAVAEVLSYVYRLKNRKVT